MSLLVQAGLKGLHSPRLVPTSQFAFGKEEDRNMLQTQQKNISYFTRKFVTDNQNKDDKSNVVNKEDPPSQPTNNDNKNDKLPYINFASFQTFANAHMRKITEINKYVTEASKKLMTGKDVNTLDKDVKLPDSIDSFEQSMKQVNLSIASFYDTSLATNAPHLEPKKEVKVGESKENISYENTAPTTVGPLFPRPILKSTELKKKRAAARRDRKITRLSLEDRTRSLVKALQTASSLMAKMTRTEELCEHLILNPDCVWDANAEKAVPLLIELTNSPNKQLKGMAFQTLSLLGHVKPLTSPGTKILSIDGGGTKGLVTLEFLKALEKQTGRRTHELFDYACGASTGALLIILVCLYKLPLDRVEQLYKEVSTQMFTRSKLLGATKLVTTYGYYDSNAWEILLRKEVGEVNLVDFAKDPDVPKVSAVSSIRAGEQMVSHLFRTYNPPPGVSSQYAASTKYKVWQAIRASSAAPGYFTPFQLDSGMHEDGGVLTNNPTALAIHESRLLWPNEKIQCVVSLGTGRYDSIKEFPEASVTLRQKLSSLVNSATDTEGVHNTLQDLLPAGAYFRFNPFLTEEYLLDEIRPAKMAEMTLDAQMYTRRNSYKLKAVSEKLMENRKPQQRVGDWVKKSIEKLNN